MKAISSSRDQRSSVMALFHRAHIYDLLLVVDSPRNCCYPPPSPVDEVISRSQFDINPPPIALHAATTKAASYSSTECNLFTCINVMF